MTDSGNDSIDYDAGNSVLHPCGHMRHMVSGLADGSLKGLGAWYTRLHIKTCAKCRLTAAELSKLRQELQSVPSEPGSSLTPKQQEHIETTLDKIDFGSE